MQCGEYNRRNTGRVVFAKLTQRWFLAQHHELQVDLHIGSVTDVASDCTLISFPRDSSAGMEHSPPACCQLHLQMIIEVMLVGPAQEGLAQLKISRYSRSEPL